MNTTTKQAETPIFFEMLKASGHITFEAFREDTKALDLQDWAKAKEEGK